MRVVRVLPDLPAVDRAFDYLLPADLRGADRAVVGTIVRVPLHGRRVRGWIVATDVEPDTDPTKLRDLLAVLSDGPPAEIVALTAWAARRWIGPWASLLRAASPKNDVNKTRSGSAAVPGDVGSGGDRRSPEGPRGARRRGELANATGGIEVIEWPPGAPRFDLVGRFIDEVGSTVIVLPDAGRAGSLGAGLRRAGHRVVEFPPGLKDREQTSRWDAVRDGAVVVIGGRSAVWAPVPDLRTIIVLDDGDEALQEERAPTWHARDVAVERVRARRQAEVEDDAPRLVIISPAPTLEATHLVGEERVVVPDRAAARTGWPIVEVVDPRDDPARAPLLTEAFAHAARRALAAQQRVVVVLNRVGRARLLSCVKCGELARCERCGAAVMEPPEVTAVAGARPTILECPHCATQRPRVCLACHGTRMKLARIGTSRLRDDLAALLPDVDVVEVHKGATTVPSAPVLVGTEAVLHWARRVDGDARPAPVGLVAFLDFDAELLAPRARAGEQAFWLLVRGARLLGGRADAGDARRLFIQSRIPHHEVIDAARHASPGPLRLAEAARRVELGDPPFGALAALSGAPAAVGAATTELAAVLGLRVLGPVEHAGVARILVRADDHDTLRAAVAPAAAAARNHGRLRVEVDPARV